MILNKVILQFVAKHIKREEFIYNFLGKSLITREIYFGKNLDIMPIYRPCELGFFENKDCFHYCKYCGRCWYDVVYNELKFKNKSK